MENKQIMTVETISKEKLIEFLNIAGVASKLTEKERLNFVEIAQAYQLNPFKREIHCVSYGYGENRQTSIITGYEVYIKRAERTGLLDGWHPEVTGNIKDGTLQGRVTIYRKDWTHPFVHEVNYEEVVQLRKDGKPNSTWAKMPRFMTKKVAIAQGFRLCFSDELGGMPCTADELPEQEKPQTQVIQAEVITPKTTGLTEEQKSLITNATNEEELKKVCGELLKENPTAKAESIKLFNSRLGELQGAQK